LTAGDGSGALDLIRRERPDLVVCDIQIPVLDGLGVARAVKADPDLSSIPLVAVTALAMVGDRDRMLAAGFDGYISKPITPETFVSQVEAYLPHDRRPRRVSPVTTPVQPAVTERARTGAHGSGSILIVDDVASNRDVLTNLLEAFGYSTHAVATITEGLQQARASRPDLIICDVHVGSDSGFELLHAVKNDPELADMRVAMISATGWRRDEQEQMSRSLGATTLLDWQQEPTVLLASVARQLR
jgi:two-component system cell cycle response regulator